MAGLLMRGKKQSREELAGTGSSGVKTEGVMDLVADLLNAPYIPLVLKGKSVERSLLEDPLDLYPEEEMAEISVYG